MESGDRQMITFMIHDCLLSLVVVSPKERSKRNKGKNHRQIFELFQIIGCGGVRRMDDAVVAGQG